MHQSGPVSGDPANRRAVVCCWRGFLCVPCVEFAVDDAIASRMLLTAPRNI